MRLLPFILAAIFCNFLNAQQDNLTTQFAYNKLLINPSYAGVENRYTTSVLIRDQWNGLEGAPKYQAVNLDFPLITQNIGLGFNLTNREIGIRKRIRAALSYAYIAKLKTARLHIGMNVSYTNHVNDFTDDRLLAIDGFEIDPSIEAVRETKHLLNVGVGVYYRVKGYYISLSAPDLLENNTSDIAVFSKETNRIYFMMGKEHEISQKLKIFPEVLFRVAEAAPISVDFQLRTMFDEVFLLGLNYRSGGTTGATGESIGVMAGLNVSKSILFGIAYDFNMSSFNTTNNGSIEAFIRYRFGETTATNEIVNPRYF